MPSTLSRQLLAAVSALALPAAFAQGSGLVSLDLTVVSEQVAKRMDVDESRMPMSVLAPVAVAAAACAVRPEALQQQVARGGGACTATEPVPQLDALLRDRMHSDAAMGGPPVTRPGEAPPEKQR